MIRRALYFSDKIKELDLLKQLFTAIYTTSIVKNEFGKEFPSWINIVDPIVTISSDIILNRGELSVISLAVEMNDIAAVILDDLKARRYASRLGLKVIGTLGFIVECKLSAVIPSVKPIFTKIRNTNFRFTESLEHQLLKLAGEE